MSVNEWIALVVLACFLTVFTAAAYLADYWLNYWPALQPEEVQDGA